MRVTSEIWVSALIRRAFAAGAAALVRRRGDATAGAIWVVVDRLDGTVDLHVPLPQSEVDEAAGGERRFETVSKRVSADVVSGRVASEARFDSDLWVVEIEDRDGRSFLDPPPRDPDAPAPDRPAWPPKP